MGKGPSVRRAVIFLAILVTSTEEAYRPMPIRAVIFDLDGTITQPYFDFDAIRAEMGLSRDTGPVLEAMEKMTPQERRRAERILHDHEDRALAASRLNPGARQTLGELRQRGIRVGVLTRNRKRNAVGIAEKHDLRFDGVVGREDGPVKPDGFGVRYLCGQFGVTPPETLVVGDYLYDLLCARAAGAIGVLIANHPRAEEFAAHADHRIESLDQILPIIDQENTSETHEVKRSDNA
jgi:HAD superfamily hydrolase (TIGR01509 family)